MSDISNARTPGPVEDLLTNPLNWTREIPALDANGHEVNPGDDSACQFCLVGAIEKCYKYPNRAIRKVNKVLLEKWDQNHDYPRPDGPFIRTHLTEFNDDFETKHSDMLDVVRAAGI